MTKIIVDMDELKNYSKQLMENAHEFDDITKKMSEIIGRLTLGGWKGYDSETFVRNVKTYLNDLKGVRNNIAETSLIIQDRANGYSSRVDQYFETIKEEFQDEQQ